MAKGRYLQPHKTYWGNKRGCVSTVITALTHPHILQKLSFNKYLVADIFNESP